MADSKIQQKNVSMGILLKTNREAQNLYQKFAEEYKIHLISSDSTHFANGISVTSIQMSKGLEFDEVLIPYVSNDIYNTEYDRNLLYIAATRAMHRLTLLYTGSPSRLLPDALIFSHKE